MAAKTVKTINWSRLNIILQHLLIKFIQSKQKTITIKMVNTTIL